MKVSEIKMMKKAVVIGCLAGLFVQSLQAQQPLAGEGEGANELLARGADKDAYIDLAEAQWEDLKTFFKERKRKTDPFGSKMDPGTFKENVVVPEPAPEEEVIAAVVKKVIPLQAVVDKFQVTGVNAKKQLVMVGFRSLRRGDPVEIKHLGVRFKLRIEKITTNTVVFLNTSNNETATVRLGVFRGFDGFGGGVKSGEQGNPLKKNVIKENSTLKIE